MNWLARRRKRATLLREAEALEAEAEDARKELARWRFTATRMVLTTLGRPGGGAVGRLVLASAGFIPPESVDITRPTHAEILLAKQRNMEAQARAKREEAKTLG